MARSSNTRRITMQRRAAKRRRKRKSNGWKSTRTSHARLSRHTWRNKRGTGRTKSERVKENRLRRRRKFERRRLTMRIIAALSPRSRHKRRAAAAIHRDLWGAHGYAYRRVRNPKEREL